MGDRINDSVGKKIVEALKMQNQSVQEVSPEDSLIDSDSNHGKNSYSDAQYNPDDSENNTFNSNIDLVSTVTSNTLSQSNINNLSEVDNAFQASLNQNLGLNSNNTFNQMQYEFELPGNVAILNRLISKLPTGVSKQTGAVIIRQTMEALGISMDSVIQEAKNVQDTLTNNARECQRAILDYRKQISELEVKSQQYQRQAVTMNDVINLFSHS